MEKTITFTVNGQSKTVTTDPERPLLEVLREDLQLTGPKMGCHEGKCGACTVLINGRAMVSCITPVGKVENQAIVTIEGLANGETLHPVQEAFLAEGAMQCGTCTPGMILTVVGLLNEKPQPNDAELLGHLEGHICRCCGHTKILKAARRAIAPAGR
jgi:aerobic carbon-monoxide dehydrogenase small subunit